MFSYSTILTTLSLLSSIVAGADLWADQYRPSIAKPNEFTGRLVNISNVNTYVSLPPKHVHYKKSEAIIYLSDVFGLGLPENKLLADKFAAAGYAVFLPDYISGDFISIDDPNPDIPGWLSRHGTNVTLPLIYKVITELRKLGVRDFAATGYCFGGPYILHLATQNDISVAATAHPSFLNIPQEFVTLRNSSTVPILVQSGEQDWAFTPAQGEVTDNVMYGNGNYSSLEPYEAGYKRVHFDAPHSFAIHPTNASDPKQIEIKEGAFQEVVSWFHINL